MTDIDDFRTYLRRRMVAQAQLLATLTTHPTLIGHGREQAISDLIRQFVPRRFEVLSGGIVPGDPVSKAARQIDVMVADTLQYPSVLRVGEVAILLPDSVRAAIEVKSSLRKPPDKEKLLKALSSDTAEETDATDADEEEDEDGDDDGKGDDGKKASGADPSKLVSGTGDNADDLRSAAKSAAGNPKRKPKKKPDRPPLAETFFDAMVQVGRLQELFDSGVGVFTALVSYSTPKKVKKLRQYLEETIKLREECRVAALANPGNARLRGPASALSAARLPDMIVVDAGPIAMKTRNPLAYQFFRPTDDLPALLVLLQNIIMHVSAGGSAESTAASAKLRQLLGPVLEPAKDIADLPIGDTDPTALPAAVSPVVPGAPQGA